LELDWERRYDHMQQHTAQHLLSSLALAKFGWQTRSFRIGPETSHIELGAREPTEEQIEALEEMVASAVRESRWIRAFRVGPDQLGGFEVRSRGLPEGHAGDVRLVEIEGIDRNTCGGTHVGNTAEVEVVKTVGSEAIRGGCRLSWVAGRRARRRLAAHEARVAELRGLLDTGDDELASVIRLRLEQLRQSRREVRRLEAQLAVAIADRAAADAAPVLRVHLGEAGASLVRSVAEALGERAGSRLALVTATDGPSGLFVVLAGPDCRSAGRRQVGCPVARGSGWGRRSTVPGSDGLARRARRRGLVPHPAGSGLQLKTAWPSGLDWRPWN
jgi:alanyl-tRNA synthetase